MNTELRFSSETDLWSTPQLTFDELDKEFHFVLDVCATAENAKCKAFYTETEDGLKQSWSVAEGAIWMNPPYGRRHMPKWIKKAYEVSRNGSTVVCLLPSRTDTRYFHDIILPYAKEIRFIKGRLKFGNSKNSAPFPSMIVVFEKGTK